MKCDKKIWSKIQANRFKKSRRYTRLTSRKTTVYKCPDCFNLHLTTNRNNNII